MQKVPEDDLDVQGLIQAQRMLAKSKHPYAQVVAVLWISGTLKKHLARLRDRQIGQLLWDHLLPELRVFGPEEAICEDAVKRLVRSGGGPWREQDDSLTNPATPPCPVCGSDTFYHIGIDEPDFLLCGLVDCGHKEPLGVSEGDARPEED